MDQVRRLARRWAEVCYTLDAGPNVHCICVRNDAEQVSERLKALSEVLEVCTRSAGIRGTAYHALRHDKRKGQLA